MTNEELEAEIDKLRERIETLELDITLLKVFKVTESYPKYPDYLPWTHPSPSIPAPMPYWHGPTVTLC